VTDAFGRPLILGPVTVISADEESSAIIAFLIAVWVDVPGSAPSWRADPDSSGAAP